MQKYKKPEMLLNHTLSNTQLLFLSLLNYYIKIFINAETTASCTFNQQHQRRQQPLRTR